MVVEAALGATLSVASRPYACVHGIDGWFICGKRMLDEQTPQSFDVDPPSIQCGVKTAPVATVRSFEAQVNRRRDTICGEDGVSEFEEGVGPKIETFVE